MDPLLASDLWVAPALTWVARCADVGRGKDPMTYADLENLRDRLRTNCMHSARVQICRVSEIA